MNRDYFTGGYMQIAEVQPSPHYRRYDAALGEPRPEACGVTAAGGGALPVARPPLSSRQDQHLPQSSQPHQHASHHADHRKRRYSPFSDDCESTSATSGSEAAGARCMLAPGGRRRKTYSYGTGSTYDDDGDGDDSRSTRSASDKKQNHSEIEKRRRDKMNTYISELAAIVPMCGAMARKLDKLTVLRLAVQHLRSVRGALSSWPLTACPRPAYVTERELNDLVLAAGRDAFVLVVGCDRGRVLYASASVSALLHYDKSELLGLSLFDILHPRDVGKVKEQLSAPDLSPRERLIDAKTMQPVQAEPGRGATRLCPGARRSFFCRIKTKGVAEPSINTKGTAEPAIKEELDANVKLRKKLERKYCVVQCTGYLKSWAPAEISESGDSGCDGGEDDAYNMSCLVAVGRALQELAPPPATLPVALSAAPSAAPSSAPSASPLPAAPVTRKLQFLSRHATDGKYVYVDQRVTLALGYLPQELLGTSLYEYVSGAELGAVARAHKAALVQRDALRTPPYAARRKDGSDALLVSHFKPFRNPWTKEVECLIALNTVMPESSPRPPYTGHHAEGELAAAGLDVCANVHFDEELQRLIDSQVEAHTIGSAIAEEALRRSPSSGFALDMPAELLHDALFNNPCLVDSMLSDEHEMGEEAALGAAAAEDGLSPDSPSSLTLDGNNEAAMAVIMSLLEADAGLGGPVNFSGLPWPLP